MHHLAARYRVGRAYQLKLSILLHGRLIGMSTRYSVMILATGEYKDEIEFRQESNW
jgi:hypothetical protein